VAGTKAQTSLPTERTGEQRRNLYGHGASRKGRRTRALLLAAARTVFERDGYLNARVADIVSAAGVSHGTFYTYFESKVHIFRGLMTDVNQEMAEALSVAITDTHDTGNGAGVNFPKRLDLSNRRFLEVYRKNAVMLKLIEQQATADPEVGKQRITARRMHIDRIASSVRRLQQRGLADRRLDSRTAAAALAAMISNFAYYWYSIGEPFEEELAKVTLNNMWLGAIGYPREQVDDTLQLLP
jgi:AcrR family transcriptional regulator